MRKVLVVDCETTGLDYENDEVVEVAAVLVDADKRLIVGSHTTLVDPIIEIPPEARAIHHISSEDVHGWPELDQAMRDWVALFGDGWTPAAHYAEFDSKFIPLAGDWICTNRCAKHLWPDAPSHSNQALRYWLPDLDFYANMEERSMPPHRAGPDAWVTAHILLVMLRTHTVDQLVDLTKAPILLKTCGFGKHRGTLWNAVPRDYLGWIVRQPDFDPDVVHTAKHWMGGGR